MSAVANVHLQTPGVVPAGTMCPGCHEIASEKENVNLWLGHSVSTGQVGHLAHKRCYDAWAQARLAQAGSFSLFSVTCIGGCEVQISNASVKDVLGIKKTWWQKGIVKIFSMTTLQKVGVFALGAGVLGSTCSARTNAGVVFGLMGSIWGSFLVDRIYLSVLIERAQRAREQQGLPRIPEGEGINIDPFVTNSKLGLLQLLGAIVGGCLASNGYELLPFAEKWRVVGSRSVNGEQIDRISNVLEWQTFNVFGITLIATMCIDAINRAYVRMQMDRAPF